MHSKKKESFFRKKELTQNLLDLKNLFLPKIVFDPQYFWSTNYFGHQIFLDTKFVRILNFWTHILNKKYFDSNLNLTSFLNHKFFGPPIYLDLIFFGHKSILGLKIYLLTVFRTQYLWTQNFVGPKIGYGVIY